MAVVRLDKFVVAVRQLASGSGVYVAVCPRLDCEAADPAVCSACGHGRKREWKFVCED